MALRRISHGKDLIALAADLSLHLAEMIDLPTGRCAPGGGERTETAPPEPRSSPSRLIEDWSQKG